MSTHKVHTIKVKEETLLLTDALWRLKHTLNLEHIIQLNKVNQTADIAKERGWHSQGSESSHGSLKTQIYRNVFG